MQECLYTGITITAAPSTSYLMVWDGQNSGPGYVAMSAMTLSNLGVPTLSANNTWTGTATNFQSSSGSTTVTVTAGTTSTNGILTLRGNATSGNTGVGLLNVKGNGSTNGTANWHQLVGGAGAFFDLGSTAVNTVTGVATSGTGNLLVAGFIGTSVLSYALQASTITQVPNSQFTVLTGTNVTSAGVTLPAVSGLIGYLVIVKSQNSTAAITVNADSGSDIMPLGSVTAVSSVSITSGNAAGFISDGTYWNRIF